MVFGISMVVASFALGGVISADYCRFAKSRSDVVKSSVVGVIPAGLFMLLTGALMSIVTGQYDISAILASLGVPFVGLVALVLATWTTNVTNAYSGGLALSNLLGFDESKFVYDEPYSGTYTDVILSELVKLSEEYMKKIEAFEEYTDESGDTVTIKDYIKQLRKEFEANEYYQLFTDAKNEDSPYSQYNAWYTKAGPQSSM